MLKKIIWKLVNAIYLNICPVCSIEKLEFNELVCYKCFEKHINKDYSIYDEYSFDILFSGCQYNMEIKKIVYGIKNKNRYFDIASFFIIENMNKYFMETYKEDLKEYKKRFDYIVFVPINKKHFKERKYNQAKKIAESLNKLLDIKIIDVFNASEYEVEQKELNRKERFEKISKKFYIKKQKDTLLLKDSNILLVDDVFTTGASVDYLSCLLKNAGAKKVAVAIFAKASF